MSKFYVLFLFLMGALVKSSFSASAADVDSSDSKTTLKKVKSFEAEGADQLRERSYFLDRLRAYKGGVYTVEGVDAEISKISNWGQYALKRQVADTIISF